MANNILFASENKKNQSCLQVVDLRHQCVCERERESTLYFTILYAAYREVQCGNLIHIKKLVKMRNLKKKDTPVSHVASQVTSFRLH